VPATWSPQGEFEGNEYEIHRAQYGWRDLRALGFTSIWRIANHLIALRSPRPVAVRGTLLRWAAMSLAPLSVADFVIGVRDRLSGRRQLPPAR
jgi:hypothetical protein